MRLSWSLAFNRSADFLFRSGASSKESSSALSSLPLERKKAFSSLSQEIKKDGIKPVIFYLPWMRLSWSLAFNRSADFLFRSGASSKESSSALSSLPLERKKAFSSLSQEIKKDGIKPVIFYLPWMRFERMTYRLEVV